MEKDQPLCLACAGMGDLEFLGRGDTALTRRATKYSTSRAVVVEFSRSRGRYERQGILVTEAALRPAGEECAADAPARARKRVASAEARKKEDAVTVEKMTAKIRAMFPGCPPSEAERIAAHTSVRGSGRIGRSEAGRKLDSDALTSQSRPPSATATPTTMNSWPKDTTDPPPGPPSAPRSTRSWTPGAGESERQARPTATPRTAQPQP